MRRPLLALIAALATLLAAWPAAAARSPTPLRLVAEHAGGVRGDGERWVIVSVWDGSAYAYDVYDTWTGARSRLPEGCGVGGILEQTTAIVAGRALLDCADGYAVLNLATGERTLLPATLADHERRSSDGPGYYILGRRWVWAEGTCTLLDGSGERSCDMYVDFRTGAARVYPGLGNYRDLDDPGLGPRRACQPRLVHEHEGGTLDAYRRHHAPPYFVGARGLRRCRDGRLLLPLPRRAVADLAGGLLSWGNPFEPRRDARVAVYDIARDRVHRWRLPRLGQRRRLAGLPVHTRCEVFVATSLSWTDDGYVSEVRVHRARLPAPRDPRCRT